MEPEQQLARQVKQRMVRQMNRVFVHRISEEDLAKCGVECLRNLELFFQFLESDIQNRARSEARKRIMQGRF